MSVDFTITFQLWKVLEMEVMPSYLVKVLDKIRSFFLEVFISGVIKS